MRHAKFIVALLLALCIGGCWPEEKIIWSPDGRKAVVLAGDGMYLCDAEGNISGLVVEGVSAVDWLGEGSDALVTVKRVEIKNWKQAQKILPKEEIAAAKKRAAELLREILAHQGDMEDFKPSEHTRFDRLATVYLRHQKDKKLFEKLGDKTKELRQMTAAAGIIQKYKVDGLDVTAGKKILSIAENLIALRVSPGGEAVSFLGPDEKINSDVSALYLVSVEGGRARLVDRSVAMGFDWTPDGHRLVYIQGPRRKGFLTSAKESYLGRLCRMPVTDAGEQVDGQGKSEPLAALVYNDLTGLRCLSDERVLFASREVTLPAVVSEFRQTDGQGSQTGLFILSYEQEPSVKAVLDDEQLAELHEKNFDLTFFSVNPAGTKAAIKSADWNVAIIELKKGTVKIIDSGVKEKPDRLMALPTWRGDEELCFVVPPGSKYGTEDRPEVVLWSEGKTRRVSESWDDDIVESFVAKRGTAPVITTAPAKDE